MRYFLVTVETEDRFVITIPFKGNHFPSKSDISNELKKQGNESGERGKWIILFFLEINEEDYYSFIEEKMD